MKRIKLQEYVHEEHGVIVVHWREEPGYHEEVPYAFESDLFCPEGEVEHLREWMKSVRLDRSVSVSGMDTLESA